MCTFCFFFLIYLPHVILKFIGLSGITSACDIAKVNENLQETTTTIIINNMCVVNQNQTKLFLPYTYTHIFRVEMCLFYHDLIIIENVIVIVIIIIIIIIIIMVVFITFLDILLRELLLLFNYSMHVKIKNEDNSHVILIKQHQL